MNTASLDLNACRNRLKRGSTASLCSVLAALAGAVLSLALLLVSTPVWSQATTTAAATATSRSESMPPWTVLVLKLVSATHVQPTTGIVIAAPDLVVVGIDFAREGDEIMVLDGGTDIVRHGRPATIIHSLPADKLAILRVQGLTRPAASLSATPESELKSLNLVSFPTAEMIEQGSGPVRTTVKALAAITTSHPTLDPFPNISGAFTDACANLVAFNLSVGLQAMQPSSSPRVAWPDALKRAATQAGTPLQLAQCSPAVQQVSAEKQAATPTPEAKPEVQAEAPVDAPEVQAEAEPEATTGNLQDPAAEMQVEEAAEEVVEGQPLTQPPADEDGLLEPEPEPDLIEPEAAAADAMDDGGESLPEPTNYLPMAAFVLAVLMLPGLVWILRKRRGRAAAASSQTKIPEEPGTVSFPAPLPAEAPLLLSLTGEFEDGIPFKLQLPLSGPDWKVELGRENADLVLADPSISRRHLLLQLQDGRLSISDLDTTNGTRLNGVPCLPGEVFLVQSGDQLQLGEVLCRLELVAVTDTDSAEAAKPHS